ncbi:MAG TPA: CARDB domain-containing protein [Pyrinomonadaceae bacterium]|jgi:subtilase family serine protease
MYRTSIALTGLLVMYLFHPLPARSRVAVDLPDLRIRQYEFVSTNDKQLRVQVANQGKAASRPCRLELAIRKIKGTAVGRTAYETIPALEPGKAEWVDLTATGILPAAISLKETTFRLTADETGIVAESNEDNNETWHNLH